LSNGKEHARSTSLNLKLLTPVALSTGYYNPLIGSGLLVGGVLGHYITPDFDVNHPIYTQRKLIQRNSVFGWLLVIYWWPYSRLIPHRGSSHTWPIGTAIRFLYCLWLPLIYSLTKWGYPAAIFWLAVFASWTLQDLTHLAKDNLLWPHANKPAKPHRHGYKPRYPHYR